MKTEAAIHLAGGTTALASLLGITPGAVSQWGEEIPDAREWQLRVIQPAWFDAANIDRAPATPLQQAEAGA
jgi:hypothetical protein